MCRSSSSDEKVLQINQKVCQKKSCNGRKIKRRTQTVIKKVKKRCDSPCKTRKQVCHTDGPWRCPNNCGFTCVENTLIIKHQRVCQINRPRCCPSDCSDRLYANTFVRPCSVPYQTVCTWEPQTYHPAWSGCDGGC